MKKKEIVWNAIQKSVVAWTSTNLFFFRDSREGQARGRGERGEHGREREREGGGWRKVSHTHQRAWREERAGMKRERREESRAESR